jgi:cobalt/nickel transport system permease protein
MNQLDSIAYTSKIAAVHPKGKLCLSFTAMILCIFLDQNPISLLIIFVFGGANLLLTRIYIRQYLKLLCIPAGFLIIGTCTIIISKYSLEDTLLLGIRIGTYQYGLTAQSLSMGIRLLLKSLGSVSALYFLSLNTPMTSLFQYLHHTRLPSFLVTLMELIYHYIFILWEESDKIKNAQESRLGYWGFKNSIRSLGILAGMLFLRSYQRCDRIYTALESRGYNGAFETLEEKYLPCKQYYLLSILLAILLIAIKGIELYQKGWILWKS